MAARSGLLGGVVTGAEKQGTGEFLTCLELKARQEMNLES